MLNSIINAFKSVISMPMSIYSFLRSNLSSSYEEGYLKGYTIGNKTGYTSGNKTGYDSGLLKGRDEANTYYFWITASALATTALVSLVFMYHVYQSRQKKTLAAEKDPSKNDENIESVEKYNEVKKALELEQEKNQQLSEKVNRISNANKIISDEKETITSDLTSKIEELEKNLDIANQSSREHELTIEQLNSSLDEENNLTKQKSLKLQERVNELKESVKEKDNALNKKEGEIVALKQSLQNKSSPKTPQKNITLLGKKLEEQQKITTDQNHKLSQQEKTIQNLRAQINTLQKEIECHKDQSSNQKNTLIQEQTITTNKLKNDLTQIQIENDEKEKQLTNLQQKVTKIEATAGDLKRQITEKDKNLNASNLSLAENKDALEKLKKLNSELESQLKQSEKSLTEINEEFSKTTNTNFELSTHNDELKQTCQAKNSEIEQLQLKIQKSEEQIAQLTQQIQQLEQPLERENNQIDIIPLTSTNTKSLLRSIDYTHVDEEDDDTYTYSQYYDDDTEVDSQNYENNQILGENTLNLLAGIDSENEEAHGDHSNYSDDTQSQLSPINSPVTPVPLLHKLITKGNVFELKKTISENPASVNRCDEEGKSPLYWALSQHGTISRKEKGIQLISLLASNRIEIVKLLLKQPQLNLDLGSSEGTITRLLTGEMGTKKLKIAKTTNPSKGADAKKMILNMICQRRIADLTCSNASVKQLHELWTNLTKSKGQLTKLMKERDQEIDQMIDVAEKTLMKKFPKLLDYGNSASKELTNTCALADTIYHSIMNNNTESLTTCGIKKQINVEMKRVMEPLKKHALSDKIELLEETNMNVINSNNECIAWKTDHTDPYWIAYQEFIDCSLKILIRGNTLLEAQSFNPFEQRFLENNEGLRNELLGNLELNTEQFVDGDSDFGNQTMTYISK